MFVTGADSFVRPLRWCRCVPTVLGDRSLRTHDRFTLPLRCLLRTRYTYLPFVVILYVLISVYACYTVADCSMPLFVVAAFCVHAAFLRYPALLLRLPFPALLRCTTFAHLVVAAHATVCLRVCVAVTVSSLHVRLRSTRCCRCLPVGSFTYIPQIWCR